MRLYLFLECEKEPASKFIGRIPVVTNIRSSPRNIDEVFAHAASGIGDLDDRSEIVFGCRLLDDGDVAAALELGDRNGYICFRQRCGKTMVAVRQLAAAESLLLERNSADRQLDFIVDGAEPIDAAFGGRRLGAGRNTKK